MEKQMKFGKGRCFGDVRRERLLAKQARKRAAAENIGKRAGGSVHAEPRQCIILDERCIACRSAKRRIHTDAPHPELVDETIRLHRRQTNGGPRGKYKSFSDSHGWRGRK